MNNDRRNFIRNAGAAGLASALLPGQVLAAGSFFAGHTYGRDAFEARVNDWFHLLAIDAADQCRVELIDMVDLGSGNGLEQFTLTFRSGRQDLPLPPGTYGVAGEGFDIFVQHTHEQSGRQFYRAEFSLLQE